MVASWLGNPPGPVKSIAGDERQYESVETVPLGVDDPWRSILAVPSDDPKHVSSVVFNVITKRFGS